MCYKWQEGNSNFIYILKTFSGACMLGENCHFAHGEGELRATKNYKTAMCFGFQKGECVHGDKCKYAHGE